MKRNVHIYSQNTTSAPITVGLIPSPSQKSSLLFHPINYNQNQSIGSTSKYICYRLFKIAKINQPMMILTKFKENMQYVWLDLKRSWGSGILISLCFCRDYFSSITSNKVDIVYIITKNMVQAVLSFKSNYNTCPMQPSYLFEYVEF